MGFDLELLQFVCSFEFWRMAILWPIALLFSYIQLNFGKCSPLPRRALDPATRPVCVVTGATSGLGAAMAKSLATEGCYVILGKNISSLSTNMDVILQVRTDTKQVLSVSTSTKALSNGAGRSSHVLDKFIQEIQETHHGACLQAFQVDLSSLQSIMEFKSSLEQWLVDTNLKPSIQLLINNAGILATSSRLTSDGYDEMMETNYIGAFALTHSLLPLLRNSSLPPRIVNVTSFTHRCVSHAVVDEEMLAGPKKLSRGCKGYPFAQVYEYSKLCLLLFSYELHRRLWLKEPSCRISVMAADPGVVETRIMREVPPLLSQFSFTVLRFLGLLHSPGSGIQSIIDAALAPQEESGLYFFGGKGRTIASRGFSYDTKLSERLWDVSIALLQQGQFSTFQCTNAS